MKILAILSITLLTFTTTAISAPKKLTCTERDTENTISGWAPTKSIIVFYLDTDDFSKERPIATAVLKKLDKYDILFEFSSSLIDKKFQLPYKVSPTTLSLTYYYGLSPKYLGYKKYSERKVKVEATLDIDRKTLSFKDGKCSIEDIDTTGNVL